MSNKVKNLKLFGYDFIFVFRHRFEKDKDGNRVDKFIMWSEWRLGFFFRKFHVVSRFNKVNGKMQIDHVNEYMFGLDLLWCKVWFRVSKSALVFDIEK